MNFFERKKYCENLIEPFKDQLSDEALAEIHSIYEDYDLEVNPNEVYTDEELEAMEMEQKFELCDMICYILDKNGFPVYDNEEDEDKERYTL